MPKAFASAFVTADCCKISDSFQPQRLRLIHLALCHCRIRREAYLRARGRTDDEKGSLSIAGDLPSTFCDRLKPMATGLAGRFRSGQPGASPPSRTGKPPATSRHCIHALPGLFQARLITAQTAHRATGLRIPDRLWFRHRPADHKDPPSA
jgi:hypothetical protein